MRKSFPKITSLQNPISFHPFKIDFNELVKLLRQVPHCCWFSNLPGQAINSRSMFLCIYIVIALFRGLTIQKHKKQNRRFFERINLQIKCGHCYCPDRHSYCNSVKVLINTSRHKRKTRLIIGIGKLDIYEWITRFSGI